MTVSINQDVAVVFHFRDAEACFLLQGEGQIPADESRDFQVRMIASRSPVTLSHHRPARRTS
jgi:hypothetical protein